MVYKKFNQIVLASFALASLVVIGVNAVLDPYGVIYRKTPNVNSHFLKMKYLTSDPSACDSFLFGSSRAIQIDTRKLPEARLFNLSYSEGIPADYLKDLTILMRKGVTLKRVIIGLDDFSYMIDPQSHHDYGLRHPYGTAIENLEYYFRYLFHLPTTDAATRFFSETACQKPAKGAPCRQFIRQPILIGGSLSGPLADQRLSEAVNVLGCIKKLCDSNGASLTLFINPLHEVTYLACGLDRFEEFKRRLAGIGDYYDFSGVNSITANDDNYIETSHYKGFVGDLILARLFNLNNPNLPPDFGVFVTRKNVEEHLARLRESVAKVGRGDSPLPVIAPGSADF